MTTNIYKNLMQICTVSNGDKFDKNVLLKIAESVDDMYFSLSGFMLNNMNFNNAVERLTVYYAMSKIEDNYMIIDYICRFKNGNIVLFKDTPYGVDRSKTFTVLLVKENEHNIITVEYSIIDVYDYLEICDILCDILHKQMGDER